MAKSFLDNLVLQATGGNPTPEAEAAAARAKAYMEQLQREQMMASLGAQMANPAAGAVSGINPMSYRPEGAYQSPNNTMTNIPQNIGGMNVQNTTPPMDLNSLLRILGYR
jgi:hypothetical protein